MSDGLVQVRPTYLYLTASTSPKRIQGRPLAVVRSKRWNRKPGSLHVRRAYVSESNGSSSEPGFPEPTEVGILERRDEPSYFGQTLRDRQGIVPVGDLACVPVCYVSVFTEVSIPHLRMRVDSNPFLRIARVEQ